MDRFGGLLQVVSWQKGDVYIYMRNERLRQLLGTDGEGGVHFVFPFMGDELKGPISCRRMQSKYKCDDIKTRTAVPVVMRLTLDWKVSDPYRFIFEVEHVRRYSNDKPQGGDDMVQELSWTGKRRNAALHLAPQRRAESDLRRRLGHADLQQRRSGSQPAAASPSATSVSHARNIEKEIMNELSREMAQANLGLEAISVIVEDVGLRRTSSKSCWKWSTPPKTAR